VTISYRISAAERPQNDDLPLLGKKGLPRYPKKPYTSCHDGDLAAHGMCGGHPGSNDFWASTIPMNDITPLDVLPAGLRKKWNDGGAKDTVIMARATVRPVHSRPSKVKSATPNELDICHLSDAELAAEIAAARAGVYASGIYPNKSA
jgi:hypothetical protein